MNKRIVYGIIVFVAAGVIAALALSSLGGGVCGPTSLEHCNRACDSDDDCMFTCGCGAISVNETCTGGNQIRCLVAWPTECRQGWCEIDAGS